MLTYNLKKQIEEFAIEATYKKWQNEARNNNLKITKSGKNIRLSGNEQDLENFKKKVGIN